MRPHEPHPDCPDTLACLPDTNGRPQHTLPVILRCAILGSPKKRLTIREIYAAMEKKYPYYKTAGPAWKVRYHFLSYFSKNILLFSLVYITQTTLSSLSAQQSVRHHLSLNRLFERQPRPATDPGFGSYWTVNLEAPPGTKRPRKRGRTQKDTPPQPTPAPDVAIPYHPVQVRLDEPQQRFEAPPIATLRPVDASSFKTSAIRNSPTDDDDDDEMGYMGWGEGGPIVMSDDEYNSDELHHHAYQYHPPPSASSSSSVPTPTYNHSSHTHTNHHSNHSHGPSSARHGNRNGLHVVFSSSSSAAAPYNHAPSSQQDSLVKQLQQEIDSLRRQSADQEHLTLRLSNQLTRAETDAARSKQALKMAESRLEDETRRRVEAERAADEEARARRVAEDQLRTLQLRSSLPSPR